MSGSLEHYDWLSSMTISLDGKDDVLAEKLRGVQDYLWKERLTEEDKAAVNARKEEDEADERDRQAVLDRVKVNASDAVLSGLGERLRKRGPPDFRVTEATLGASGRGYFVVNWGTVSAGFGQLTMYKNEEGELEVDTEAMGRSFCVEVLTKLFDSAYDVEEGPRDPTYCEPGDGSGSRPQIRVVVGPTRPGYGNVYHLRTDGKPSWCSDVDPSDTPGHVRVWPGYVPVVPDRWCPECDVVHVRIHGKGLPEPVLCAVACTLTTP